MKLFVSEHNYYPGTVSIKAGTVFSESQWVASGGTEASLKEHVAKGYITEAVQTVPKMTATVPAATVTSESVKTPEAPVVPSEASTAPTGVWNFTKEELEPFGLPILNTMLKDRAEEFGLEVEPFNDKDELIAFMTSEA